MDDHVAQTFRVAVTADAFDADGKPRFAEMGLEIARSRRLGVEYRPLAEYIARSWKRANWKDCKVCWCSTAASTRPR